MNEFNSCNLNDENITGFANGAEASAACLFFLEENDIDVDLIERDIGAMLAIFIGFRTLALCMLIYRARY